MIRRLLKRFGYQNVDDAKQRFKTRFHLPPQSQAFRRNQDDARGAQCAQIEPKRSVDFSAKFPVDRNISATP